MIAVMVGTWMSAAAYDFTGKSAEGKTMFFTVNAKGVATCEVTFDKKSDYTGIVSIPETVEHDGRSYKVTAIGKDAFKNCGNMIMVKIPNTVRSIGEGAFENCSRLKLVDIPASVMHVQKRAFANCPGMTKVVFGKYLASVGDMAFEGCRFLAYVTFNSQVKVGARAFAGCDKIVYIYNTSAVPPILERPELMFVSHVYKTSEVYAPKDNLTTYKSAAGWREFSCIKEYE